MFSVLKNKKFDFIAILIVLVNVILATYYFSLKNDFHLDEFYSFSHANSITGAYLGERIYTYTPFAEQHCAKPHVWTTMLTTSPTSALHYDHVYYNLTRSVHPPLYYLILHTVSHYFPNTFSKWLGYPINLLFFVFTLFALYKLSNKVFKNKRLIYPTLILFGFSLASFDMFTFIRSYMLQAFLGTYLIYEHIKIIERKNIKTPLALKIFLLSCFAFLTHYYFLIFMFFISVITGFYLLYHKNYKALSLYAFFVILSIVLSLVSFPEAMHVLQESSRTREAQRQFALNSFFFIDSYFYRFFRLIFLYILPFNKVNAVLAFSLTVVILSFLKMQKIYTPEKNIKIKYLLFYVLPFCFLIIFMAPDMFPYDDRYFMPILPALCILLIYLLDYFCNALKIKPQIAYSFICFLVAINALCTNFPYRTYYPLRLKQTTQKVLQEIENKNILLIGKDFQAYNFIANVSNVQQVCFLRDEEQFIPSLFFNDIVIVADPKRNTLLRQNFNPMLTFVTTFSKGIYSYDIYRIRKFF